MFSNQTGLAGLVWLKLVDMMVQLIREPESVQKSTELAGPP